MTKTLSVLTLATILLFSTSAIAADKVVVIPLGSVTAELDPVWTAASTSVQDNIDTVDNKADSNTNSITTINSRQRLTDTDTGSLVITSYNQDISAGMSLNVQGCGRDILIIASINVNNTVDASSPHDTELRFDVRFNSVVRRTEMIVLKADSRHIFTVQWLERAVTTATHAVDVIVSATNRVNLENRYLYAVEL